MNTSLNQPRTWWNPFFLLILGTLGCMPQNPQKKLSFSVPGNFRSAQLDFSNVKSAYENHYFILLDELKSLNIHPDSFSIYMRVFKTEEVLELWCRNASEKKHFLLKTFSICAKSGELGPKRKEGDLQVPEGFYFINHFNPLSKFHLSLGINYPNPSDLIFADTKTPGGEIYLHGGCVTIGCLPLTDVSISELYVYAVEAKNAGQIEIPVTIFPFRKNHPDKINFEKTGNTETLKLWKELEKAERLFEESALIPEILFLETGRHEIKNGH